MQLTKVVPFLLEDAMKRMGGNYEKADDWVDFAVIDGRLITGQNPASSSSTARALMTLLTTTARTSATAKAAG